MAQRPAKRRGRTAEKFFKALQKTDEVDLTVSGRISGRKTARPVWFVHEGKKLYLLPVKGSETEWYKNILKHPTIELSAEATTVFARLKPITDPARVKDIIDKFRAKHGAGEVKKYYSRFDVACEVTLK